MLQQMWRRRGRPKTAAETHEGGALVGWQPSGKRQLRRMLERYYRLWSDGRPLSSRAYRRVRKALARQGTPRRQQFTTWAMFTNWLLIRWRDAQVKKS